jgi:uncharacterized protein YkwD
VKNGQAMQSWAQLENLRNELLLELNRARASGRQCGVSFHAALPPLSRESRLDAAAQAHTEEMARDDHLDHVGRDGWGPFDRIRAVGYSFRVAAENIASGSPGATATLWQWLNSPGHCVNIMGADFLHLGIGHARAASGTDYWTVDFGTPW